MTQHQKAALRTFLMALFLVGPLYFLWWVNHEYKEVESTDFGPVSEFAFATIDGKSSFTHFDTFKRVSVVSLVENPCEDSCKTNLITKLTELKAWSDRHLVNKNKNDAKPQEISYVVISKEAVFLDSDLPGFKLILLDPGETFQLPEAAKKVSGDDPLIVAISQEGRFKGAFSAATLESTEKLERLLAKLTAENYLLHYLTLQNLMWEKAKNYARGRVDPAG